MKFIHTSDWHLGHTLVCKNRESEHQQFLDWLICKIDELQAQMLIIAGDIFDSSNPPGYAQKMYFDFLCKIKNTGCKNVVIIGGNHDSPAFLNASEQILKSLDIHVIAKAALNIDEQLIQIRDPNNETKAIVCAVPFLRDKDVRKSLAVQSTVDKEISLANGIKNHYQNIATAAQKLMQKNKNTVPLIATGHLFVAGCKLSETERDIYVGNLNAFPADNLNRYFQYVALGHLHKFQSASEDNTAYYCGSPIPMSFSEAKSAKYVIAGSFEPELNIEKIEIPVFQLIKTVKGSFAEVIKELKELSCLDSDKELWVEIQIQENRTLPGLTNDLDDIVKNTNIQILSLKHVRTDIDPLDGEFVTEKLSEITPEEVFERRLQTETDMSDDDKDEMRNAYRQLLNEYYLQDKQE